VSSALHTLQKPKPTKPRAAKKQNKIDRPPVHLLYPRPTYLANTNLRFLFVRFWALLGIYIRGVAKQHSAFLPLTCVPTRSTGVATCSLFFGRHLMGGARRRFVVSGNKGGGEKGSGVGRNPDQAAARLGDLCPGLRSGGIGCPMHHPAAPTVSLYTQDQMEVASSPNK
jgi:hypothetical protein